MTESAVVSSIYYLCSSCRIGITLFSYPCEYSSECPHILAIFSLLEMPLLLMTERVMMLDKIFNILYKRDHGGLAVPTKDMFTEENLEKVTATL